MNSKQILIKLLVSLPQDCISSFCYQTLEVLFLEGAKEIKVISAVWDV